MKKKLIGKCIDCISMEKFFDHNMCKRGIEIPITIGNDINRFGCWYWRKIVREG